MNFECSKYQDYSRVELKAMCSTCLKIRVK